MDKTLVAELNDGIRQEIIY
uniref:Uncharacterized protein n=1 Tax=Lepeophtheirus salmonis TaxID=72036 RepID=A0A0K2U0S5_LEPSM